VLSLEVVGSLVNTLLRHY